MCRVEVVADANVLPSEPYGSYARREINEAVPLKFFFVPRISRTRVPSRAAKINHTLKKKRKKKKKSTPHTSRQKRE